MSTKATTAKTGAKTSAGRKGTSRPAAKPHKPQDLDAIIDSIKQNEGAYPRSYLRINAVETSTPNGPVMQLQVTKGGTIQITGGLTFVKDKKRGLLFTKNPNNVYDAWVYWPDKCIAGTVGDIVDLLDYYGFKTIPVGKKREMVNAVNSRLPPNQPPFETLAIEPQQVSLDNPNIYQIIYNNSFDPYATPDANAGGLGYTYHTNGGTDAEVIKLLFAKTDEEGETKGFPISKFYYWLQVAAEEVGKTNISAHVKGAKIQKLIADFDEKMADLEAYYNRTGDYNLEQIKAQKGVQAGPRDSINGIEVSSFDKYKLSGVVSSKKDKDGKSSGGKKLSQAIKVGHEIIPTFKLNGNVAFGPVMFVPQAFHSAVEYFNIISQSYNGPVEEGGANVVVASEYQDEASQLSQSAMQLAGSRGYIFGGAAVTATTTATPISGATRRARGGAAATASAPAPAPAPATAAGGRRGAAAAAAPTSAAGGRRPAVPATQPAATQPRAPARAPTTTTRQPAAAAPPARQGGFAARPGVRPAGPPAANPASAARRGAATAPQAAPARTQTARRPSSPVAAPAVQPEETEQFEEFAEEEPANQFRGARNRSRASSRASSAGSPVVTAADEE